jgi:hypothetical protein
VLHNLLLGAAELGKAKNLLEDVLYCGGAVRHETS